MDEFQMDEKTLERLEVIKSIPKEPQFEREVAIRRAAVLLGRTEETVKRYLMFVEGGEFERFVHGNTGRVPAITFNPAVRESVIHLYKKKYRDASITHFVEILAEDYSIIVSDQTVRRWLRDVRILSPRSHRRTKKAMNKVIAAEAERRLLEAEGEKAASKVKELVEQAIPLSEIEAHPTRTRSKYFGEVIQMDASQYRWNGINVWHLHLAVDDATGHVVGAYFDYQETLNGYYHVLEMILRRHGIPLTFYTDKRTVFEYNKLNKDARVEENDTMTQFTRACDVLGIGLKTTSVSQAKGLVERLNQSFQHRLPIELRRHGITSMEAANNFLRDFYIDAYNNHFAPLSDRDKNKNVFVSPPSDEKINQTLVVIATRSITPGNCIKFANKYYFPVREDGSKVLFKPRTSCSVIKAFDGSLFVNIKDGVYCLLEVEKRQAYSNEFDSDAEIKAAVKEKEKQKYIPPADHPWRAFNFKGGKKHV